MSLNFKYNKITYDEFIEASEWYELKQDGLGEKFIQSVEKRIIQISNHPERYSKKQGNFRQVKIENFPYSIVYEFFKQKQIIHIAAIYHSNRNPKLRFRKLNK